jgi:hypothetical protein
MPYQVRMFLTEEVRNYTFQPVYFNVFYRVDSEGKVNILAGEIHMTACIILDSYRDRVVGNQKHCELLVRKRNYTLFILF